MGRPRELVAADASGYFQLAEDMLAGEYVLIVGITRSYGNHCGAPDKHPVEDDATAPAQAVGEKKRIKRVMPTRPAAWRCELRRFPLTWPCLGSQPRPARAPRPERERHPTHVYPERS